MKNEMSVNNQLSRLSRNTRLLRLRLEAGATADNRQVDVFPMCDKGGTFSLAASGLRTDQAQGPL